MNPIQHLIFADSRTKLCGKSTFSITNTNNNRLYAPYYCFLNLYAWVPQKVLVLLGIVCVETVFLYHKTWIIDGWGCSITIACLLINYPIKVQLSENPGSDRARYGLLSPNIIFPPRNRGDSHFILFIAKSIYWIIFSIYGPPKFPIVGLVACATSLAWFSQLRVCCFQVQVLFLIIGFGLPFL